VRVRAASTAEREAPAQESGGWAPGSWRSKPAKQQPQYDDEHELEDALDTMRAAPPLVFAGECRQLMHILGEASLGRAFCLTGGDCAESFANFSADGIRDSFRVLLQMAAVLMYGSGLPVVKMGRMAGQYGKPRSKPYEERDGVELPAYRGDNVNAEAFTSESRRPDPQRLIQGYNQAAATLNLLRSFSQGGYASIRRLWEWNLDFMRNDEYGARYKQLADRLDDALAFMQACGIDSNHPQMSRTDFYTAHEALLLPYEEALTRLDSTTNKYYACSAHFLWCGERTRQEDHAHIEFLRGVSNPIGIKVSHKCDTDELLRLIDTLNPYNEPGKLSIITRMGSDNIRNVLPDIVRAVECEGKHILWVCDPMHGNTQSTDTGYKTRPFDRILDEIAGFFDVHDDLGTHPGGVHVEMTGANVTECTGGTDNVSDSDLPMRYETQCDPRLNASQALELAFLVAERLKARRPSLARPLDEPRPSALT
jgi:3-deoxy-7-phosphoheptulonate synthase